MKRNMIKIETIKRIDWKFDKGYKNKIKGGKMPRIARKNIENSYYYHIIVQGINKEYIFKKKKLKEAYRNILKKNLQESNIIVLAYCIMDNHAHILIYSDNVEKITKLMHKTNTSYAKLYNGINKRVGYVFRDRFYSQMILNKEQLFNCIAYIHNNPIKANMIKDKKDYLYSSYKEYLGKKELITKESIKLTFGSVQNYQEIFQEIHKRENIEDIAEIKEEKKDSSQIIYEYLKRNHKQMEQIVSNEDMFSELLLELRHCGGVSLRQMAAIFNINKDKLNKIIHKKL